ncbi:hypothetical protein SAMN02910298_02815 [Pseudobutyrivibrio sp. YE44]|uniref:hypothetical protein n=1 Tax=Pseudobutyrivibrio sp. YE44 TaxID=1520802 RepID=UPI00088E44C8|nr:hypothetical protein [Pseudobutyrivibrio sp. YE44]SDB54971.1 hypothetical protein SAMN02910298_02815 [Pseudobutyrivibrio sp. YE44]
MKKKLLILGLVSTMALSMVACGGDSNDTKVIENDTDAVAEDTDSAHAGTPFLFEYDGMDINVDDDIADYLDKLGEPNQYFESPSCAAEGIGKLYTYSDFEIQTYPDGDVDRILYIRLRTDNVSTKEGIDLSSSKDDIIAAYGAPKSEETGSLIYELNGTTLKFIFDGDSLSSIEYDSELNN